MTPNIAGRNKEWVEAEITAAQDILNQWTAEGQHPKAGLAAQRLETLRTMRAILAAAETEGIPDAP